MPSIPTIRDAARRRSFRIALTPMLVSILCCAVLVRPTMAQDAVPPPVAGGSGVIAGAGGEPVLLRESPGFDAPVLGSLWEGTPLDLLAGPLPAADGTSWFQVASGQSGFVPAGYVAASQPLPAAATGAEAPPAAVPADLADQAVAAQPVPVGSTATNSDVNLRSEPSTEGGILTVLPPCAPVEVTGTSSGAFTPVTANGVAGWVASEFLGGAATPASPSPAGPAMVQSVPALAVGGPATTTDLVNLRTGPSYGDAVLTTIAPGTPVDATGAVEGGFFPVVAEGQAGWIASEFLAFGTDLPAQPAADEAVDEAPELALPEAPAAPMGGSLIWPFAGGTWEVIQGYNNGTHTNRGSFANYQYSLDLARSDGDTAGQPVLAPASGTVRWVDGGSGGILIDMGNGYGIAMFHLTIDPGIGTGDAIGQGQVVGTVSGPGGPGYAATPHIDVTLWQLTDGGSNISTPFAGQFALSGREFPASGSGNQYMGEVISA